MAGIENGTDYLPELSDVLAIFGMYAFGVFAISILMVIATWIIYKKAGQKGWASIVPIYNTIVLLRIVELPTWYVLLLFVPFVNVILLIYMNLKLAAVFGKSTIFGIFCLFLPYITYPILAFGNNTYNGFNTSTDSYPNMTHNDDYNSSNDFFSNVQPTSESVSSQPTNVETSQPVGSPMYQEPLSMSSLSTLPTVEHPLSNENPNQATTPQFKVCPSCSAKVSLSSTYCFLCGTKL